MRRTKRSYLFQPHEESLRESLSAEIPESLICRVYTYYCLQEKAHRLHHLRDYHIHCHSHVHSFICSRNFLCFMLALLFLDYLRKQFPHFTLTLPSMFNFKDFHVSLIKQETKYSKYISHHTESYFNQLSKSSLTTLIFISPNQVLLLYK